MKVLLQFLILSAICYTSFAQSMNAKCRANYFTVYEYDGKKVEPAKWDSCNLVIVFSEKHNQLKIYASEEQTIDLVKRESVTKEERKTTHKIKGIDEKGEECTVLVVQYLLDDIDDMVIIRKKTMTYAYKIRCKVADVSN